MDVRNSYELDKLDTSKERVTFIDRSDVYPRYLTLSIEEWVSLGKPFEVVVDVRPI